MTDTDAVLGQIGFETRTVGDIAARTELSIDRVLWILKRGIENDWIGCTADGRYFAKYSPADPN